MKRLGALEALGRGISNVRGNLELVGVWAAGSLLTLVVVLLALVPFLGLGGDQLASVASLVTGRASAGDIPSLMSLTTTLLSDLWGLVLALTVGLTIGSIVFSWYLGGILGVLVAGDAQAPPGSGRGGELFRTWSWRFFLGEASRLVWRVLFFYSLWLLFVLVALLLFVLLFAAAAMLSGTAGWGAALALGCGGALPLFFLLFAVLGAMTLGQVELVPPESGVRKASETGVALLGRRLGAAVALFALFFLTSMAVGMVEAGLGFVFSAKLGARGVAFGLAQGALFAVQLMISALLNLVLAATFVALARSESRLAAEAAA